MFTSTRAYSGFAVDDLERAAQFYTGVLGLEVRRRDDAMGVMTLRLGSGADVLVYARPGHEPASFTVLNFPVPDVEAAVDALVALGVRFERYDGLGLDQDERGIHRGGGPLIAWFTDPAGNVMSVIAED